MNLDTAQLRIFATVAELRSFTKASERLFRVQSAISQQIQRLENQVGFELFIRDRKGLRITVKGEALLAFALKMLAINDQAVLSLLREVPVGRLRIGTSDTYATCFLSGILRECSRVYPGLEIEVHCGYSRDIWTQYEQHQLDLALTQCCPSGYESERVHIEPLRWVCAKDSNVYQNNPVPLALFTEGCADRNIAIEALAGVHKDYCINFHSTSHAGILAAVRSGCSVSALLASTAAPDLRTLSRSDGFPLLDSLEISMAYHDHGESSLASCFAEIVRSYFSLMSISDQVISTQPAYPNAETAARRGTAQTAGA
jgi:DNA-binding transcriptional LysR family regulator